MSATVAAAPRSASRGARPVWSLVVAAVLVQIVYPLMPEVWRTEVTVTSVAVFFLAALADVARLHGVAGAVTLLAVAGGGGLAAEAVGVATGVPFGDYHYTGTLGLQLLGVPVVVPLAWVMMAWPALVVARTLARRTPAVLILGALALTAWDVFLDPQMVAAGHWRWEDPDPGLPFVPGIPLTNYAGWLLVSTLVVGLLHLLLRPSRGTSGPAAALYLWTYGSSVVAHLVFFGLPGSSLVGGLAMGSLAVPFAVTLLRRRSAATGPPTRGSGPSG